MGKEAGNTTLDSSQIQDNTENEISFEERVAASTVIAKPMCSKKTLSRIRKLIKKGMSING